MDCKLADKLFTPCRSSASCGWVDSTSGYVHIHHCSEISIWTLAAVWFIKQSLNVTSRTLHPLTQHPLSFSAISVPLYHSKVKDQANFTAQCFICIAHMWKIKGGLIELLFSLTSSASLWLVEILKMDDSIVQTLLVIFWAHIGWTDSDRNQIYMLLSFPFLKKNAAAREQGSNTRVWTGLFCHCLL